MTKISRESADSRGILKNTIILVLSIAVIELVLRQSSTSDYYNDSNLLKISDSTIKYPSRDLINVVNTQQDQRITAKSLDSEDFLRIPPSRQGLDLTSPLAIPSGQAENLPSVPVEEGSDESVDDRRKIYGGRGDKLHLGGFVDIDVQGISPTVWKYMITDLGVNSVLDVGCGRGISTAWFYMHGCDVLCVEGSHDAIMKTVLPDPTNQIVEHDYTLGPWWPEKTYDAVWAVEFVTHIGLPYQFNYIASFRKAALIFVTSSRWGGWHHVEVHNDAWWIRKFESYGFKYDDDLTMKIRQLALDEKKAKNATAPNGEYLDPMHISQRMKVFINPAVASLPQHAHLFPEHGCYGKKGGTTGIINRICGTGKHGDLETPLPDEYWPLELTDEMDDEWDSLIQQHLSSIDEVE